MYERVSDHLPPSYLRCRSYGKDCWLLCLASLAPVHHTERECPAPPPSTMTVHSGPDWCRSLGIYWNTVDKPAGKQRRPPQDWGSSPYALPPCSTALPQMSAPSAGCPSHPIAPSAEELASHLMDTKEKTTAEQNMSYLIRLFHTEKHVWILLTLFIFLLRELFFRVTILRHSKLLL